MSLSVLVRSPVLALAAYTFATAAFAGEPGVEISYGAGTESCPTPAALHRSVGKPPDGLQVTLRFRRTQTIRFAVDLTVAGRLHGTRVIDANTCRELEGATALNIKLLDYIARLTNDQERAEKVASLLTTEEPHGELAADNREPSDADVREAERSLPTPRPKRRWMIDVEVPNVEDRRERWSPAIDFVGLFGMVRNGALAASGGISLRVGEHWHLAAALIFAPPRDIQSANTSISTALLAVSTGVCRTLIRSWSLSSLEICGNFISGAVHIAANKASGSVSADTPWLGLSTELVLDASITRNLAARLRGGVIVPFYSPSTSLPELAGTYESLKLGAITGVGLVAHFE